jgi:RNA polymerase sigma-70 factor (ECF subfamily)
VNTCIDFLRKRKHNISLNESITSDDTNIEEMVADMDRKDMWTKVQQKIKQLPLRQKNVLILKHFEGLTIQQISKVLGCSQSSVKTHLCRAIERLKKELG